MFYDFDWPGAERECKRAIELNPNYSGVAYDLYSQLLSATGRLDKAIAIARRGFTERRAEIRREVALQVLVRESSLKPRRLRRGRQ